MIGRARESSTYQIPISWICILNRRYIYRPLKINEVIQCKFWLSLSCLSYRIWALGYGGDCKVVRSPTFQFHYASIVFNWAQLNWVYIDELGLRWCFTVRNAYKPFPKPSCLFAFLYFPLFQIRCYSIIDTVISISKFSRSIGRFYAVRLRWILLWADKKLSNDHMPRRSFTALLLSEMLPTFISRIDVLFDTQRREYADCRRADEILIAVLAPHTSTTQSYSCSIN